MRRILPSALLLAGVLLCCASSGRTDSGNFPPLSVSVPGQFDQGVTRDPAAAMRITEYRVHPEREGENADVPPMLVEPSAGSLKPRPITAKDFYLNLLDVSNRNGIVVKFSEEAMIRWRDDLPYSKSGVNIHPVFDFLARHPGIIMDRNDPLHSEELFDYWEANGERNTGQDLANLNNFYEFYIPDNPNPLSLIREVLEWDFVETAWYVPLWQLACTDVAPTTPGWEANQDYLDPAPLGIDAQYAWAYHPTLGRGKANYWNIDIEGSWTENHEDFPASFSVLMGGDHGWLGDHGDAVVGIIAACDNGYGMTGISSNISPRAISWPWQTGATDQDRWISAFNGAASYLFSGEAYLIEIHYPGPNPGYACDSINCGNCGQFQFIAVEYWDNVFTAIQTHTANGIIVYEAAGNGQMDLDNAVYGNRFQRWYRDSGAILVGAGIPNTRAGECWSNYGTRCDLQGWGSSVYTCGYGYLWQGSVEPDRSQWYTGSFGGTSSATPIVTGAGNILQAISQGKYGITLSPANVRSYLSAAGTAWTGTHDVGERPNLASAINYIEPDVTYQNATGWSYPLTPRNTAGATSGSCLITPLVGNTNNTYLNVFGINSGRSPAADCTATGVYSEIYLDSPSIWWLSWGRIAPGQGFYGVNNGPVTVRGGRHTLRWWLDPNDQFNEYNENNNAFTKQFVWSPLVMTAGIVYTRTAPPLKSWGSPAYYNGDGLRASGGWWLGVAVLPQAGNDVDLYSFNPAYTCSTGFDVALRTSAYGSGYPDLILTNGNQVGYGPTRNYQAVRYSDASASDYRAEADTSRPAWSAPYDTTDYLPSTEIFDMYELYLYSGQQYFIGVTDITPGLDLKLSVYHRDSVEISYSHYLWYANNTAPNGSEYLIATPAISGYYAAVVMKSSSDGWGVGGWYTFKYETPGTPNLSTTPIRSGWDAPLVIRHTNDATTSNAVFPAALQHDAYCYFNAAWINKGTAHAYEGYWTQIGIDGQGLFDLYGNTLNPFVSQTDVNDGPWEGIRGGRHTITMTVDLGNSLAESDETDNEFASQYVWSPLPLSNGVGLGRFSPPNKGSGTYYNNDGFSFNPGAYYGSVVGVLPTGLGADYDMYVYSDYAGTFSGYSNLIGTSAYGSCAIDYVFIPWRLEPAYDVYYPAAINWNAATDAMFVEAKDTQGRVSFTDSMHRTDSLMNDNILNPYEFWLNAGSPYVFDLHVLAGSVDLEMRIFRDSLTVFGRPYAMAVANTGGIGADEQLSYTPSVSDWYMLVVAKSDCYSGGMPVWYDLNFGPSVPPPVTDLVIENWLSPEGVRLSWSHVNWPFSHRYVVYRNVASGFIPADVDSIGQTTDSTYVDVNPFAAVKNFYCVKVKPN